MRLQKITWVSTRGWWGYERNHGSLQGGGGAIGDTMDFFCGWGRGVVVMETVGLNFRIGDYRKRESSPSILVDP